MLTPERTTEIIAAVTDHLAKAAALMAELRGDNRTLLGQYIDATLHHREDCQVAFSELYSGFKQWLPERERDNWPKARVLQELPVVNEGRSDQPRKMIQGLSWHPAPALPGPAEPPPPKNPDYDKQKMYWLATGLKKEGLNYLQVADRMNKLGHRDENGEPWDDPSVWKLLF